MKHNRVLITGGTGSFGQYMTRFLLDTGKYYVRIFSRDEQKQEDMRRKFGNKPIRENNECPFQFYPINIVACKALHKRPSDDYPLCKYEDCPFKIPDSLKEKNNAINGG